MRVIVNIDGISNDWSQVVPVQAVDRSGQVVAGWKLAGMVEDLSQFGTTKRGACKGCYSGQTAGRV